MGGVFLVVPKSSHGHRLLASSGFPTAQQRLQDFAGGLLLNMAAACTSLFSLLCGILAPLTSGHKLLMSAPCLEHYCRLHHLTVTAMPLFQDIKKIFSYNISA